MLWKVKYVKVKWPVCVMNGTFLRIYPIVPLIAAFNIFPSEKGGQGNIAEM